MNEAIPFLKGGTLSASEIFRQTLSMMLAMPRRVILPQEGRDGLHWELYENKSKGDTQMDSKNVYYMTPLGWLRRNAYTTESSWSQVVVTLEGVCKGRLPSRSFREVYQAMLSCISLAKRREEAHEVWLQFVSKKKKKKLYFGGVGGEGIPWKINYPPPPPVEEVEEEEEE